MHEDLRWRPPHNVCINCRISSLDLSTTVAGVGAQSGAPVAARGGLRAGTFRWSGGILRPRPALPSVVGDPLLQEIANDFVFVDGIQRRTMRRSLLLGRLRSRFALLGRLAILGLARSLL